MTHLAEDTAVGRGDTLDGAQRTVGIVEDIFGGNCGDVLGGEQSTAKKVLIDGQLYILRPDGLYNATGARLQ